MAWANLVRSTRAVFSGNKICSKHSGKASPVFLKGDKFETYKDKANKVSQFARRFNYNFVSIVNRSHRFYSTVPSSAISDPFLPKGSGKASPILPMGDVHSGGLAMSTSTFLWKRTYCQRIPGLLPFPRVQSLWNQLISVEKKNPEFWRLDYFGTLIFRGAYRATGVIGWNIHLLDIKQVDGTIKSEYIIAQTKILAKLKEGTVDEGVDDEEELEEIRARLAKVRS